MTVRLALYKAPGDLTDRAVRLWTRSVYSHCELVLSDGRFVSSSPRDGGVRAKCIEPSSSTWDFVALPWVQQEDVEAALEREGGTGYDWVGIIGSQLLPVGIHSRKRWFCSEFCGAVMGLEKPERYSPGELAELVAWMVRVSVPNIAL